jgi:hypothetical protein
VLGLQLIEQIVPAATTWRWKIQASTARRLITRAEALDMPAASTMAAADAATIFKTELVLMVIPHPSTTQEVHHTMSVSHRHRDGGGLMHDP